MLTCSCGSVLVSDGKVWRCPWMYDENYHAKPPETIPDKRTTTQDGQSFLKSRVPGRVF